jgi:hypothetical protein
MAFAYIGDNFTLFYCVLWMGVTSLRADIGLLSVSVHNFLTLQRFQS